MAGLASMIATHRELDVALNDTMVTPWAESYRALMQRAAERGEIRQTSDIETVSQVIPYVAAYRALVERKPFDRDFLVNWVDGVVLPAVSHQASPTTSKQSAARGGKASAQGRPRSRSAAASR